MKKVKVLHTITRLVVGGAQENTIITSHLLDNKKYDIELIRGPQTGVEGSLLKRARKWNLKIFTFPYLVREISLIKDLFHLFKMIIFLEKKNYTIVHTHSSKAGVIHRLAAKIARVPIIIHTVHGWSFHTELPHLLRKFYIFWERIAAMCTDKIITVSACDVDKGLKEHIAVRKKYITIHSSIDIDKYAKPTKNILRIKQNLGLDKEKVIVGTVSRMVPQKAPLDFISVAHKICKKYDNVQFLFVGDGELKKEVEKFIANYNLENNVILAGLRKDIPDMLAVMDIFVLTSLWEGLPRVFPQAMAAKLPVIATKLNGSKEIIKDNWNGYMTESGKPDQIVAKLEILINNKAKRERLGLNGFNKINPKFCVYKMTQNIDLLYQKLLKKHGQLC